MNQKFIKRSLAQGVHSPSIDRRSIAMAKPYRFGFDGRAATCTEVRNSNPSGVRESNRVSNWLFRVVALLAVVLTGSMSVITRAEATTDLFFLQSIEPANDSNISSFEFILTFNLDKIIADYGEGDYGVGYYGYYNKKKPEKTQGFEIYEGDKETGTLVTRFTSTVTGVSNDFILGNQITISITDAFPEPDKDYTVYISNDFRVYKVGETVPVGGANGVLSFLAEPIVLKYKGASGSVETLSIETTSIKSGSELDILNDITYSFNQPVAIGSGKCILSDGTNEIETSSYTIEDKSITFHFDNEKLFTRSNYEIILPEGSVIAASDNNIKNDVISLKITGTYLDYIGISNFSPTESILTNNFSCSFNLPENLIINKIEGIYLNLNASLYKDSVDESNLIDTANGTIINTSTLAWEFPNFSPDPSSTYILYLPKGQFYFTDKETGKYNYSFMNNEVSIPCIYPTFEEAQLPPMEFQAPEIVSGKESSILESNQKVSFLPSVQLALKDLDYIFEGKKSTFWVTPDTKYHLYEITGGTEVLISEGVIALRTKETTTQYYSVLNMTINKTLFDSHKYKLVIPEGEVTVSDPLIQNYVRNPEWSIEIEGGTPTETTLTSCTLQDNAELSALPVVIWNFEGVYVQNPELSAILHYTYQGLTKPMEINANVTTLTTNGNNNTRVVMLNYDYNSGEPRPLRTDYTYEVILPEGVIYYPTDPDIKNPEMRYTIIPVEKKPEVEEPEFVELSVSINGLASAVQPTVKGQPVTVKVTPSADWKLETLTRNGNDVIDFVEDDSYTTPALNENTTIEATVEYNGLWAVEASANVWEIKESNITISAEDNRIVVTGVTPENEIRVYGVNGMLINSARVADEMNRVYISVAPDQMYIVVVDGKAAKIQL